ncbi:MAG: universal stress protein [Rudaea sp.]
MRDILVYANNVEMRGRSLVYAAQFAAHMSAALTGIYVSQPVPIAPVFGGAPAFPEFLAVAAQVADEARKVDSVFCAWAGDHGVSRSRWVVAQGDLCATLANIANWHDLLVLESQTKAAWSSIGMLGEILITCGVPCLIVPESYAEHAATGTVVVAWDGSVESIRAVHAAMPLLKRAEHLIVLDGAGGHTFSTLHCDTPLTLDAELARHGIRFSRRLIDATGDSAGQVLLDAAWEARADLVIMGAYGSSRYSEWMFGGATRHVLSSTKIPVFMRH